VDLLRALAVGQRDHVMACLMAAHAEGTFRHKTDVDAATWQEWWTYVMGSLD
jgi:hypothetical protein